MRLFGKLTFLTLLAFVTFCSKDHDEVDVYIKIDDNSHESALKTYALTEPSLGGQYCYIVHVTGENIPDTGGGSSIFNISGGSNRPDKGKHCTINQGKIYGPYTLGQTAEIKIPEDSNLTIELLAVESASIGGCGGAPVKWSSVADFDNTESYIEFSTGIKPFYKHRFYRMAKNENVSVSKGDTRSIVLEKSASLHVHPCASDIMELYTSATPGAAHAWIGMVGYSGAYHSYKFYNLNSSFGIMMDAVNISATTGYYNVKHGICDPSDPIGTVATCMPLGAGDMAANFQLANGAILVGTPGPENIFYYGETIHDNSSGTANIGDQGGGGPWTTQTYGWGTNTTYPKFTTPSTGIFFPTWGGQSAGQKFEASDGLGTKWAGGQATDCTNSSTKTAMSCGVLYRSWDSGASWYRVFEGFKNSTITDGKKHAEKGNMFFVEAFQDTASTPNKLLRILYSRD